MAQTIKLRRGTLPGVPAAGVLADGEPALDVTVGAPKLCVGLAGQTVVLADPAHVATLEARIVALEAALVPLRRG